MVYREVGILVALLWVVVSLFRVVTELCLQGLQALFIPLFKFEHRFLLALVHNRVGLFNPEAGALLWHEANLRVLWIISNCCVMTEEDLIGRVG